MTTTILKVSTSGREAAGAALRNAGIRFVEMDNWDQAAASGISRDAARALSHELRTPLSAMSGWVHLLESGRLDEAGLKRAIEKLRKNIDDQVRTIDLYLDGNGEEGKRP